MQKLHLLVEFRVYKNLRTLNTYNKLIDPFKQNNIDLYLDVPNVLGKNILGQTSYKYPQIYKDENGRIVGISVQTDYGGEQNEIGRVKTLLHEAVHANRKYNGKKESKFHNGFDRQSVLDGLKEYNKQFLNSKYSNQQLDVISWGGLLKSCEFEEYIKNAEFKSQMQLLVKHFRLQK